MSTYEHMASKFEQAMQFISSLRDQRVVKANMDSLGVNVFIDYAVEELERLGSELNQWSYDPSIVLPETLRSNMRATASETFSFAASLKLVKDNKEGIL